MDVREAQRALMELVNGYQVTQAIHVAASLRLPDLLAEGARSSGELAAQVDAHPDALYRLLRALAAVGVLHEEDGRTFSLTPVGDGLRSDAPGSLHGWAQFVGRPYYWQAWSALQHSVRTGENAFRHLHGEDVWSYRAQRPEESVAFDAAMQARTGATNRALLDSFDFGRFGRIVDVGGGNGTLLAAVLAAHADVTGVLFDQPHVVAGAEVVLGVAGVADRCRVVAGDFFQSVPSGGDAYILKWIVHDWEDEAATALLRVVRAAMTDAARLLVVERDLGAPNEAPAAKLSDLNMLVGPGGRERTREEYAALFVTAGFRLDTVSPAGPELAVFEGAPA